MSENRGLRINSRTSTYQHIHLIVTHKQRGHKKSSFATLVKSERRRKLVCWRLISSWDFSWRYCCCLCLSQCLQWMLTILKISFSGLDLLRFVQICSDLLRFVQICSLNLFFNLLCKQSLTHSYVENLNFKFICIAFILFLFYHVGILVVN